MRHCRQIIWIAVFPAIHICLCVFTLLFLGNDTWDWIFIVPLDLPILLLLERFKAPPYDTKAIVIYGTAQWLFIGIAISCISGWLTRRREARDSR